MNPRLFIICVGLISTLAVAGPTPVKAPKHLTDQIQRLSELLRDPHATEYAAARMVQTIKRAAEGEITLVVFTIEGFGGGNNHAQFLAAFARETGEDGKPHFTLIDVIPIAGKGWRAINKLNAKVTYNQKAGETIFGIDALENTDNDAANFPSKNTTINVLLKDGRLSEVKKR